MRRATTGRPLRRSAGTHDALATTPAGRAAVRDPAALFGPANAGAADDEVVVFAAASLTDVPQAIARQGGFTQVKFSFAAGDGRGRDAPAALRTGAGPAARRFHDHLFSADARALLTAAGFSAP
jgi:hypothetical protein